MPEVMYATYLVMMKKRAISKKLQSLQAYSRLDAVTLIIVNNLQYGAVRRVL